MDRNRAGHELLDLVGHHAALAPAEDRIFVNRQPDRGRADPDDVDFSRRSENIMIGAAAFTR
jgi:hypothetical protein